jgi:hypothetical protein
MDCPINEDIHQFPQIQPLEIIISTTRCAAHIIDSVVDVEAIDVAGNSDHWRTIK